MSGNTRNSSLIDLRSDTVTRPTPAMRKAMADADVGDDVYGDDPTVHRLQEIAADMLGTEAALFLPSGTQSNLCALLSHCERGDEYIVGQSAHTYMYEGGGAAVLGSIQPQPLDFQADGSLDLAEVRSKIKADDPHFAKTRLLCLENTQGGKVLPLDYLAEARTFATEHALGLHLDGARVFNASTKLNVSVSEISRHFDSVSVCLSKGLCAPVGSVLCGTHQLVGKAHRWRKMLGGGMRQAGVLAAAGILSLTEQAKHLGTDHDNARELAKALGDLPELSIDLDAVQTNMVFIGLPNVSLDQLECNLREIGVLVSGSYGQLRLVTHFDFKEEHVAAVASAFKAALTSAS
jgi:threonine aldolase